MVDTQRILFGCSVVRPNLVECAGLFQGGPGTLDNLRRRIIVDVDASQELQIPAISMAVAFEPGITPAPSAPYFDPDAESCGAGEP